MAKRKDTKNQGKAAADIQRDASRAVRRAARTAQQSGAAKRFRRPRLGFASIIAIICVLGVALVAFAANNRESAARPRQNEDHWHSPYAVWDCVNGGTADDPIFEQSFQSSRDEEGIHSHQDGVIHIHPFFDRTSGRNAQVKAFLNEMGAEISEDAIVMPGGRELGIEEERTIVDEEGNPVLDDDGNEQTETVPVECDGEPVIIQVARWHRSSQLERDPVIYTEDLDDVRFFADQEAFVFARAPEGADIPPPPDDRVELGRGLSPQSPIDPDAPNSPDATTTTIAVPTTTTGPGATTTASPGSTTTTSPGATTIPDATTTTSTETTTTIADATTTTSPETTTTASPETTTTTPETATPESTTSVAPDN